MTRAIGIFCISVGAVALLPASAEAVSVLISTSSLPAGEVGAVYSTKLVASGGTAPYVWTVTAATLPSGLSLSSSGTLSGTPKAAGSIFAGLTATDANHIVATISLSLTINPGPSITTASIPSGVIGMPYTTTLGASGGTSPYKWSITTGPIPGGLLLSMGGTLSGRPGTVSSVAVPFRVTDALGSVVIKVIPFTSTLPPPPPQGLAIVTSTGSIYSFSTDVPSAVLPALPASGVVVGVASAGAAGGDWVAFSSGQVLGVGGAHSLGSVGAARRAVIVGIAPLANGAGYYLVSNKGKVYGFGQARSRGSQKLDGSSGDAVGIATTSSGRGYWVVTANGSIYNFGDAADLHPLPSISRTRVVGVASMPTGAGIWVATAKGRVYARGAAKHYAAVNGQTVSGSVIGIAATPDGKGYWLVTDTGAIVAYGSANALGVNSPVPQAVSVAATN